MQRILDAILWEVKLDQANDSSKANEIYTFLMALDSVSKYEAEDVCPLPLPILTVTLMFFLFQMTRLDTTGNANIDFLPTQRRFFSNAFRMLPESPDSSRHIVGNKLSPHPNRHRSQKSCTLLNAYHTRKHLEKSKID
ncbi:hypothetical protein J6590_100711 [Homalodisca vitripennis]|nr:hypothetical protein J6590_100711 [Homalodisca vitripennis]